MQKEAVKVFFSYAHRDEVFRDEMANHLSILQRQGIISSWYDRRIEPGTEWAREIDRYINSAEIILLLVSPDFIASDYCYELELKRALERHEAGDARVIPVILRPVDWLNAPFGKLQALPRDGKAVSVWANRDEAFTDVAKGIKVAINSLTQARKQKLQRYEQTFFQVVQQEYPISSDARRRMRILQTELELREIDIAPIEERLTTPIRETSKNSIQYRQEFEHFLDDDGGQLSPISRTILESLRKTLGLSPEEASVIEHEALQPHQDQGERLKEYRQVLSDLLQKEFPLSNRTRQRLQRLQGALRLTDEQASEIEAQIITQRSSYIENDDDLSSERAVDYSKLQELLRTGNWKEADYETYVLMLKLVGRESGDWLRPSDIRDLPSIDLKTIDQLWLKYSGGRFGFSTQKRIWNEVGKNSGNGGYQTLKEFGQRVGWAIDEEWLSYDKLNFSLKAPSGHLPGWFGGLIITTLFSRLDL
jgi:hypothetical protein